MYDYGGMLGMVDPEALYGTFIHSFFTAYPLFVFVTAS
jgi:hypothetical protein